MEKSGFLFELPTILSAVRIAKLPDIAKIPYYSNVEFDNQSLQLWNLGLEFERKAEEAKRNDDKAVWREYGQKAEACKALFSARICELMMDPLKESGFLLELPSLLSTVQIIEEPSCEKVESDRMKEIGILEDNQARRLWSFHLELASKAKEAEKSRSKVEKVKWEEYDHKASACYWLFWIRLNEVMNLYGSEGVGPVICEGWKVANVLFYKDGFDAFRGALGIQL